MGSKLTLVLGGTRSGKSAFAEELAKKGGVQVTYVATAACLDQEMERRIAKHRETRPLHWVTVEATQGIARVIRERASCSQVILVDCLTMLVSNLLFQREDPSLTAEARVLREIRELAQAAAESSCRVILVSSEVGLGLVPENLLGRLYRDLLGEANQIVAQKAQDVYLVVAGIPVELKALSQQLKERLENEN